jgi:hypothetical protein
MEKRIVFVGGIAVTSDGITNLRFRSEDSLLDGDIIVFSIDIASYYSNEFYQGMRCLDDDESFRLRNDCKHWRSELNAALTDGKTIITFVNNSPQVSVATGEKRYSGTGRNTRTTRIVVPFDPYHVIPCGFGTVIRRSGERIKMAGDLGILATYWHEFGNHTTYQGYIEDFTGTPILETQTGSKVVGGILRKPEWKGTLIFIPIPDLPSVVDLRVKEFQDKAKKRPSQNAGSAAKRIETYRVKAERSVVMQFISAIVGIDKAARDATESTPPPAWSQEGRFTLTGEENLQASMDTNAANLHKLPDERTSLKQALRKTQELKGLLYEKGKPLEKAILTALKLLGFQANNLQEADSEFDAVMVDQDGTRLIGEAEGKDEKAISIDKLDQLERNLREDLVLQDEATARFATGVLFGNAYRFTPPETREDFFTTKCKLAAKRSQIALVKTTDLFNVAQYLEGHPNADFAEKCRRSIKEGNGETVIFPSIPGQE